MNLAEETLEILEKNGLKKSDVLYAQGNDYWITAENFWDVAKDTEYDNGWGAPEVACDLKVVGKDWWLERDDYDGTEWWEFKKYPEKPQERAEVKRLARSDGWAWSLKEANEEDDE